MLSASLKKEKIASHFLRKGADPNYSNKNGSALHYAVEMDNDALINSLLAEENVK